MKKLRLHQYLSRTGAFASKSELLDSVRRGEISIDGRITRSPDFQLKPSRKVAWKGEALSLIADNLYIILNKPRGYISSRLAGDDFSLGKKSIFSLLKGIEPSVEQTLSCVGRLDEDTEGLIIITNDGQMTHKVADPMSGLEKTYEAKISGPLPESDRKRIESGIMIRLEENGAVTDYRTKPCKIEAAGPDRSLLRITVTEGKKREIRRMFESVNQEVKALRRIRIANLRLEDLNLSVGNYLIVDKQFIYGKLGLP